MAQRIPQLAAGKVQLHALNVSDPPIICWLGEAAPVISAGYAGWDEVSRPHRRALVDWTGIGAYRLSVDLLLDGYADGTSVESQCQQLHSWAGTAAANVPPPKVKVSGKGIPLTDKTWVISDLSWGDALRSANGVRQRQAVTLELLQAVEDTQLSKLSPAKSRAAANRRVKVGPPGGSAGLQRVAAQYLGSPARWRDIATLNKFRDPRKVKSGTVVRLPAR